MPSGISWCPKCLAASWVPDLPGGANPNGRAAGSIYFTVNFSVPDDIKAEFDKEFGERNKSAIIADLMRKAVAEVKRRKQREHIFRLLTQRRVDRPSLSDARIRASRTMSRP